MSNFLVVLGCSDDDSVSTGRLVMSTFLVVLGCSDDDPVSFFSPTVPVMSVSVSPANSSSLPPSHEESDCSESVVV